MSLMNFFKKEASVPDFFRPILWSVDFALVNVEKDKQTLIVQALNYGDLRHLRWIKETYGVGQIAKVLNSVPESEVKPHMGRLAELLFHIQLHQHALRNTNTTS